MKKINLFGRVLVCVLALIFSLSCLASCATRRGKTLMSLGSSTLSVNVYQLLLTRMKGEFARTYGTQVLTDSFWEATIELDGTTFNELVTAQVLQKAKAYLVALYLFDENGLTLPDATIEAIDEEMDGLQIGDGNGSKSELNQILSAYGVNYDILRDFYITEAKAEYLQTYLYGANGSKISDAVKEEFMHENYVRFKQIFLPTFEYVYEVDAEGNVVYYADDGKSYVYDTENGVTMTDENGEIIVDKFGNEVYFDSESNVLYDKKKGNASPVVQADGTFKTKEFSDEEIEKIEAEINLLHSQIDEGDFEDFEDQMDDFSQDSSDVRDYYLEKDNLDTGYEHVNEIRDALLEMEVGEMQIIESDSGFHLIMKYECEEGAYAEEDVSVWFTNFLTLLVGELFERETEKYMEDIEIDEELLGTVDMKSVTHNYYY